MTDELRPLEQRIFDLVKNSAGKWITRADVSRLLGRSRSYPTDVAALEKLAALGIIEAREAPRGIAGVRWEYRIKTDE
jgi:predicted transcriptional regulator